MDFNTDLISGNWRLLVFSIISCLLLAAIYLNWNESSYEASLALPADKLVPSLRSAHVIRLAVKDLGLQTSYSKEGLFTNTELYGEESPIVLRMADSSGVLNDPLELRMVDNRYFDISLKGQVYQYQYGQVIAVSGTRFSILKKDGFYIIPQSIIIRSLDFNSLVESIREQLSIVPGNIDTATFLVTLKGTHPRKIYEMVKDIVNISAKDLIKEPSDPGAEANLETQIRQVKTDLQQLRKGLTLKPEDIHLKTELQSKVSLYFFLLQKREKLVKIQKSPGKLNDQYEVTVVSSQRSPLWVFVIALGAGVFIPMSYIYRKK